MSHDENTLYLERSQEQFDSADDAGKEAVIQDLRENGFDADADRLEKDMAKELDSHRTELTTD